MATIDQLQDFNRFVQLLPQSDLANLSVDEIYERWREQAFRQEDLAAIKASLRDFENGECGRPITKFLGEFNAERGDAGKFK